VKNAGQQGWLVTLPRIGDMSLFASLFWCRPSQRQLLLALALMPLFAAIHYLAYWLRFEGTVSPSTQLLWQQSVVPVLVIKLIVFGWFGIYQGWSRYVTFHDLVNLVQAASISSLLIILLDYLILPEFAFPRSVFLMDWGATIFAVGGLRSVMRAMEECAWYSFRTDRRKPTFIVGANDTGEALLRAIRRNYKLPYRVIGFLSEDGSKVRSRIGGVPIIGTLDDTCRLAEKYHVKEVMITSGELSGAQVRHLVEAGSQKGVSVKVLPSYEQLLGGKLAWRPREVSIEDLLQRDPVDLDLGGLHNWIDGRVLLVTGSAGSIGSEICRQLLKFSPKQLVVVDRAETGQFFLERELQEIAGTTPIETVVADVTDVRRMDAIFKAYQPEIVFHAAAYKHVPLMESHPGEAVKNITLATRSLADLAHRHEVRSFVLISTDKAVNPTSVMGAFKRAAELYVQALSTRSKCHFVTVRFGNVLDSAGSVIPVFRAQIAAGGPVTVTHPEMRRFFMTIPEASQLVIQAGAMGNGGEIFVLDMGRPIRIVDLAKDMIRLCGYRVGKDIEIAYVGKRPGEKLYEELHVSDENHLATSHPKILVAQGRALDLLQVKRQLHELSLHVDESRDVILEQLRRIVPQYQLESDTSATVKRAT